jgi:Na+/H+ antiporter NhaD/arsenite permease-like protein
MYLIDKMITGQLIAQILVVILFIAMFIMFSKEKIDNITIAIIIVIISCGLTIFAFKTSPETLVLYIPFSTLIYLITMDMLIKMMKNEKIFEYFALKIIHLTRSNPRSFFYLICLSSAIVSGFMEDVSASMIFIPLVIRATKILKIKPKPYIVGLTFSILIGNLLSPLATPLNIILSDYFGLTIGWFLLNFLGLFFILEFGLLVIVDFMLLKKQAPPTEYQKSILLEIMDPNLLIVNKKKFYRFILYFIIIMIGLVLSPVAYLVVLVGILIICLIEKETFTNQMDHVKWKLPLLLICYFLMIGCLEINGTTALIGNWVKNLTSSNLIIAILIVLLISSGISIISKTFTAIMFMGILQELFLTNFPNPLDQTILIVTLLIGINLGGNLLPQASSHMLKTIDLIKEYQLAELNYKFFTKVTMRFTITNIVIGFLYLFLMTLI